MKIRPVINANATLTVLGGSLMPPPVIEAMAAAARHFVDLPELYVEVGEQLAALTRNESACVTAGAAAAITLVVASCIGEPAQSFPVDAEVVMFASQRNGYDYSARITGARIVEVGPSVAELEAAIARRPACVLWFAGAHYADGALPIEEVIRVANGVPVIVDAAAQIPPVSSLWHFTTDLGADAVIFSGGKGLRGPQATGLVLGRSWLIDRCRRHASPNQEIGRGLKVGKEELLGLLAAVEWTLAQNEPALLAGYERSVDLWLDALQPRPGITAYRGYPSEAGQPHSRCIIRHPDRQTLIDALWNGDPRISVGTFGVAPDEIALNPQTLEPGQDRVVLDALLRLVG
ncbi:hypothetical protein HPO96_03275 [Kribbella sandramycini]|uniref:L-seryl-tRNA(Ser) seleniumtransferase n=1 Tax=Kribbella sandramycini TaxID=60450 RepID=A0A7Y4NXY4_9ACTN|nr:hypothetical protein [Kribbella sandramycini]MBB6568148.1 L-seryl-tRNA(Ser) seleniumtransferase [Kribbella sandramycini]NOL39258.1 hypothetical protein [Kribbella sandramycini]